MSDFILKVFLIRHLREAGLDKVSTEIQGPHFPAPTVIYKDFKGLEFLFWISRTFKVRWEFCAKECKALELHRCGVWAEAL